MHAHAQKAKAPRGAFSAARVSAHSPIAAWSSELHGSAKRALPKGVVHARSAEYGACSRLPR